MKRKHLEFVAGLVIGAVLFGGGTVVAAGLVAEPTTQTFYLKDQQIQLHAYLINGSNYVRIRDIGEAVDFNVTYDASRNAAILNPDEPYSNENKTTAVTPGAGTAADHSAQASPNVFQGELTCEVYNAIRDTLINREAILAGSRQPVAVDSATGRRAAMETVMATLGSYPAYEAIAPEVGKLACNAKIPSAYTNAIAHTQSFIDGLAGMDESEQVQEIAWYVCDRMTYSTAIVSPARTLASDDVTAGNCMSYAHSFQFLCNRAGIPCILLHSDDHQWNKVYVNGQWWDVDVSALDIADDTSYRPYSTVLHDSSEMQGGSYINAAPEVTAFVMELLVPGSTK